MAKKLQDIFKKSQPTGLETPAPINKSAEMPAPFEAAPKLEVPSPVEIAPLKPATGVPEGVSAALEVATPQVIPTTKSLTIEKIEDVLEEDLEEVYFKMPVAKQTEFAQQGEVTANKIAVLLKETKIKIKKILELIRNWLKIIPGINKFFLEQEVKIKADKILDLKDETASTPDQNQNQNKI